MLKSSFKVESLIIVDVPPGRPRPGLSEAACRKLAVTSLLTAGRRGATRSWIRAHMPAGREKFHALVSCHCSAAWSPDKPRAGRAVSVLDPLTLPLRTARVHFARTHTSWLTLISFLSHFCHLSPSVCFFFQRVCPRS